MRQPTGVAHGSSAAYSCILRWACLGVLAGCALSPAGDPIAFRIRADAIEEPLAQTAGDAGRGREILAGRDGNCLLCHAVPETGVRFMGNLAPPLSGVGTRFSVGQLRLRIVDPQRLNAETIMPSYYRISGLNRVAEPWRGKPILNAQQVEDVNAYLITLR